MESELNINRFETDVRQKVKACVDQANDYFNTNIEMPIIKCSQKGSAAGTAYLQRHEVRFNHYMYVQNPALFVSNVVPHEVAHLFVYQLFGRKPKPHGVEWQSVMVKVFDVEPKRTHDFIIKPTSNTFLYACACSNHSLTVRRHNKILKGVIYQCRQCKKGLKKVAL